MCTFKWITLGTILLGLVACRNGGVEQLFGKKAPEYGPVPSSSGSVSNSSAGCHYTFRLKNSSKSDATKKCENPSTLNSVIDSISEDNSGKLKIQLFKDDLGNFPDSFAVLFTDKEADRTLPLDCTVIPAAESPSDRKVLECSLKTTDSSKMFKNYTATHITVTRDVCKAEFEVDYYQPYSCPLLTAKSYISSSSQIFVPALKAKSAVFNCIPDSIDNNDYENESYEDDETKPKCSPTPSPNPSPTPSATPIPSPIDLLVPSPSPSASPYPSPSPSASPYPSPSPSASPYPSPSPSVSPYPSPSPIY